MTTNKNMYIFFVILAFVIFFTTSDLIANFTGDYTCASIFSILSGFFVFLGTAMKKKENLEKGINTRIDYICSNFNKANVILSILDIICSLIALFTFVVAIGVIFRSILAIRLVVTINKVKTVAQAALIAVATYLSVRFSTIKKSIKEKIMFKKIWTGIKTIGKWFYANKKSICGTLFATLSGIISAIAVNADLIATFPQFIVLGINLTALFAGILVFAGVEIGVVGKGFETIKEFVARITVKKEVAEVKKTEKAEAKKLAEEEKAKLIEEKKALALYEQRLAEEEAAKAKAEEEKHLLELAEKLKAEEAIKQAEAEAKRIAEEQAKAQTQQEQNNQ